MKNCVMSSSVEHEPAPTQPLYKEG